MLKRPITYEDFNGNQVTEDFYFNISKPEIIEMQVEHKDGLSGLLKRIIVEEDNKELVKIFKDIILRAYGQKSQDGKRFIKSDELRTEFSQTAAFNALFMELVTKEDSAVIFLQGALPADMRGEIDKAIADATSNPVPNI